MILQYNNIMVCSHICTFVYSHINAIFCIPNVHIYCSKMIMIAIVLSVLLLFMISEYLFGICKLFFPYALSLVKIWEILNWLIYANITTGYTFPFVLVLSKQRKMACMSAVFWAWTKIKLKKIKYPSTHVEGKLWWFFIHSQTCLQGHLYIINDCL